MLSTALKSAAIGGCACILSFADPASAQIYLRGTPTPGGEGNVVCQKGTSLVLSDNDDTCDNGTEATGLEFGNNDILLTTTTANFAVPVNISNTNFQASGLQAFSGTSTFNSTVSFVGPSATFDSGATFNDAVSFNGSTSFGSAISTQGIFNTGSISSTNVFAANGGITDLSSASVDIELSLSMQSGATIDMGGNRIHGVANGVAATDAVNVAQLGEIAEDVMVLDAFTSIHTAQIEEIQAVDTAQTSQIAALEATNLSFASDIDTLFDLRRTDRRDMKQGVASAMAMASAPMPSEPGRLAYAVNGATFRGEYAVGGSLTYRLNSRAPMAVNVGFSYAGNKNNGLRVGVAGEF
jgi:autotransporter adhesin